MADDRLLAALVVLVSQHKNLPSRYVIRLRERREDSRTRRRLVLLPRRQLACGSDWAAMLNVDDGSFSRRFGLSKPQFHWLLAKLQDSGLSSQHRQGAWPIAPANKLLLFLLFMADGVGFRRLAWTFGVAQSTAFKVTEQLLDVMAAILPTVIVWPDANAKLAAAAAFSGICGAQNVIGVLDECRVGLTNQSARWVRLEAVLDHEGRFIHANANLCDDDQGEEPCDSQWEERMEGYFLLGGGAYAERGLPLVVRSDGQEAAAGWASMTTNQSFRRMKQRWTRLDCLQSGRGQTIINTLLAACCLHNIQHSSNHTSNLGAAEHPTLDDENE